jgi:predicted Zn finger-like uncharacterized protein
MLIVCPKCATTYQVDSSSLGATGRSVRCTRCRKVWFESNTDAMAEIARSHQADMSAFSTAAKPEPADPAATADNYEPPGDHPPAIPDETTPDETLLRDDRGPAPLRPSQHDGRLTQADVEPAALLQPQPLQPAPVPADAPRADIESAAARRIRRPTPRRQSRATMPGWTIAVLALVAVNIGLVGWRADVVRLFPQTASIYAAIGLEVNLRGLVFTELITRKETEDGVPMLVVEGMIKSTSRRDIAVPRLRFAIRNAGGHEIYSWTSMPERSVIAPGATLRFRSRLASPPLEMQGVLVRFFNRRDLIAGL